MVHRVLSLLFGLFGVQWVSGFTIPQAHHACIVGLRPKEQRHSSVFQRMSENDNETDGEIPDEPQITNPVDPLPLEILDEIEEGEPPKWMVLKEVCVF